MHRHFLYLTQIKGILPSFKSRPSDCTLFELWSPTRKKGKEKGGGQKFQGVEHIMIHMGANFLIAKNKG